jgi:hypothetical protein
VEINGQNDGGRVTNNKMIDVGEYLTVLYHHVESMHEVLQDQCFQDWD